MLSLKQGKLKHNEVIRLNLNYQNSKQDNKNVMRKITGAKEKRHSQLPKKPLLFITLFVWIGHLLLLTGHFVAVNYSSFIWGYPIPFVFDWQLYSISLLYSSFYSFVILYIVITKSLKKFYQNHLQSSGTNSSVSYSGLEESLAFSALYTFLASCAGFAPLFLIPYFLWPTNVTYSFLCSAIAGIWVFYWADNFFVMPKLLKGNVEALKLLYETDLRIMLQLSLIVVSAVGLYAIAIWFNAIWPSIPRELRFTPEAGLIQAIYALQVLYLILGLWFSYFGHIINRLWNIRDAVINKTYSQASTA